MWQNDSQERAVKEALARAKAAEAAQAQARAKEQQGAAAEGPSTPIQQPNVLQAPGTNLSRQGSGTVRVLSQTSPEELEIAKRPKIEPFNLNP